MRRIAFYSLALLVAGAALGCDGCGKSKSAAPPKPPLAPGESRVEPWSRPAPVALSGVKLAARSISFSLSLPPGAPIPDSIDPLIFCVPEDAALSVTLQSFSVGGKALALSPAASDPAARKTYASIRRLGVMRRWPLAAVSVAPEFWSAAREALGPAAEAATAPRLDAALEISWPAAHSMKKQKFAELEGAEGFGPVLSRLVANPESLALFGLAAPPIPPGVLPSASILGLRQSLGGEWSKLSIGEEGLFLLDPRALAAAGLDAAAPESIRAYYQGSPYPLIRRGAGANQKLYLWNDANASPYSTERVYWIASLPKTELPRLQPLKIDPVADPPRVLSRTLRVARFDVDHELLMSLGPFREILNMQWADRPFEGGEPLAFSLNLDHPAPSASPLSLEARLVLDVPGEDAPAPEVRGSKLVLSQAGRVLGERELEPATAMTLQFPLPEGALKAGANEFEVTLQSPEPVDGVWFDSASLSYPSHARLAAERVTLTEAAAETTASLNLTPLPDFAGRPPEDFAALAFGQGRALGAPNFSEVELGDHNGEPAILWPGLSGLRVEVFYLAAVPDVAGLTPVPPPSLLSEDQGADYLIIANEFFLEGVKPLADHHAARGLRVKTVGIEQIYDEFGSGEFSPAAIRALLAYTLSHWKRGAPQHVLLVGDCTSDYRGEARNQVRNWVPSFTVEMGASSWASDDWFAQVAGRDLLSDFMIGRISVNNPADLAEIVKKEIAYAQPAPGLWRSRMAFVSDTEDEFADGLNALAAAEAPPSMRADRVYQRDLPAEDNRYAPDEMRDDVFAREGEWMKVTPAATQRIYEILRGGAAMMTYFGHGSPNVWSMERMWFGGDHYASDNLHLVDSGHPVFLVNLTCNSGAIDYPIPRWNVNITEDMIRTRGGGAVGAFVPTGPGLASLHRELGVRLYHSIFSDGLHRVGEAIAATKTRYLAAGLPEDMARMYLLLGDPAMRLALPETIGEFKLPEAGYAPGASAKVALVELPFPEGEYAAQLLDSGGNLISESAPLPFAGGRIALEFALPAELAPAPHRLALYAWAKEGGADFAASAALEVLAPGGAPASTSPVPAGAAPRLRIVEGSVRPEPAAPTEGHTIFVHAEIENAGDAPSPESKLRLYDAPPAEGVKPVYNHVRHDGAPVPALAPGARKAIVARWDPVKNAGERDFWLRLEPADMAASVPPDAPVAQGKVRVLTREKLGYGRIWAAANELDLRRRRMFLKAEVLNEGETEAKNVTVFFFLGEPGDESQVLKEVLLESVPGNSKKTAIYEWDFGRDPRAAEIEGKPNFWVMIMQKASGQRIRSEAGEHSAE